MAAGWIALKSGTGIRGALMTTQNNPDFAEILRFMVSIDMSLQLLDGCTPDYRPQRWHLHSVS